LKEGEVGGDHRVPPESMNAQEPKRSYFPPDEIDEIFEKAKRLAKDPETGKTYYVDADMSFTEWYKGLTETQKGQKGEKGEFKYIRKDSVEVVPDGGIMDTVSINKETVLTNPKSTKYRYAITQEQIDDVLENELKGFIFPIKPVYNSRVRSNGRTVAEMYQWGELKRIKAIEIGKQDSPNKEFLIDTLLHEYYEVKILTNQFSNKFYERLSISGNNKRHEWINSRIREFFEKAGERL